MGYSTNYSLGLFTADEKPLDAVQADSLIDELRATFGDAEAALDGEGSSRDGCKWYDWDDNLRAFSLLHPTILFALFGEGEDQGDQWQNFFLNGKSQHCPAIITYPAYDFNALK